MGLFDKSKSKTNVTQNTTTTTNTNQTDQSGNSGVIGRDVRLSSTSNVQANKTTINTSTDQGALKIAGNIAQAGISNAQASAANALAFGKSALDSVGKANSDSIELLTGLVTGVFDNSKTVLRDAISASAQATKDASTGFAALAKETSASTDDRVGKVAMYAFAALAAVFVLPAIFGRKGIL